MIKLSDFVRIHSGQTNFTDNLSIDGLVWKQNEHNNIGDKVVWFKIVWIQTRY